MQTFKEYITELFNQPAEFELVEVDEGLIYQYKSYIEEDALVVSMAYYEGQWEVVFWVNDKLNITNSDGNEFVVFSTVIAILKDFVRRENPEFIKFSARKDERSRVSLYGKMIDKLAKENGYRIRKSDNILHIDYELQRK